MSIPIDNIVDQRLKYLVDSGIMPPTNGKIWVKEFGFKVNNYMSQRYWDRFVNLCDKKIINYVLSFPQEGNWNYWLYKACEKRKAI